MTIPYNDVSKQKPNAALKSPIRQNFEHESAGSNARDTKKEYSSQTKHCTKKNNRDPEYFIQSNAQSQVGARPDVKAPICTWS